MYAGDPNPNICIQETGIQNTSCLQLTYTMLPHLNPSRGPEGKGSTLDAKGVAASKSAVMILTATESTVLVCNVGNPRPDGYSLFIISACTSKVIVHIQRKRSQTKTCTTSNNEQLGIISKFAHKITAAGGTTSNDEDLENIVILDCRKKTHYTTCVYPDNRQFIGNRIQAFQKAIHRHRHHQHHCSVLHNKTSFTDEGIHFKDICFHDSDYPNQTRSEPMQREKNAALAKTRNTV